MQFFQSLTFCLQKCAFLFVFLLNDNHFKLNRLIKKIENKTGAVLERSYVLVRHEIGNRQTNREKRGGTEGAPGFYPTVLSASGRFSPAQGKPLACAAAGTATRVSPAVETGFGRWERLRGLFLTDSSARPRRCVLPRCREAVSPPPRVGGWVGE